MTNIMIFISLLLAVFNNTSTANLPGNINISYQISKPKDTVYNYNDTIFIKKLKIDKELIFKKTSGFIIDIHAKFKKDTASKISDMNYGIKITFSENGKKIKAIDCTHRFKDDEGNACVKIPMTWLNSRKLFVPYYAVNLQPGQHNIDVEVTGFVSLIQADKIYSVPVTGKNKISGSIIKPPVKKIKITIKDLTVSNFDSKGKYWDWPQGGPDIQFRVESPMKSGYDNRFASSIMSNMYSWSWNKFSPEIIISEGDKIKIGIYDSDVFKDDPAGSKEYSFEKLMQISKENKALSFEKVKSCKIIAEEIK